MKRSQVKYDKILSFDTIEENYKSISKSTKHKNKIIKFDIFHSVNINSIYNTLVNKKYKHSNFNIFLIKEPKYRIVMSENIIDKIVNHIVSNKFLKPVLYPKLIEENVATRVGKGTDAAIKLCKKFFIRMMNKYDKFYVLKFDITKYFYNIDHDVLKSMLNSVYDDEDIINILYEIIDSTDREYINNEIDNCINKEKVRLSLHSCKDSENALKELKKIPHYNKGKGLGIGYSNF